MARGLAAAVAAFSLALIIAPIARADDELPAPPTPEENARLLKRYVRPDPALPDFWRCTYGPVFVKTDVSDRFALDAALFMERYHKAFRSIFLDPARERWRPTLIVYRAKTQYEKVIGEVGEGSRGYYRPDPKTLYTYLDVERGEHDFASFYSKILLHEGSHQLLHYLTGRADLPVWFNAGDARFFQDWDHARTRKENLERLKRSHYRFNDLRDAYGTERFVKLRDLLSRTYETWTPDDFGPVTNLHYAEAASFVAFLVASKSGQKTFAKVYECVRDGGEITEVLGRDKVRALEKDWFADIERRIALHEEAEAGGAPGAAGGGPPPDEPGPPPPR